MTASIITKIEDSGLERIVARVVDILLVEFAKQHDLNSAAEELDLKGVYQERMAPFAHTELPALNIGVERGDFMNQHQGQDDAAYRIFIECNVRGISDDAERGDTMSKKKVQKLISVARSILMNPVYVTLGFPRGELVERRHVESFVFSEPTQHDAEYVTMARLMLVVRCAESYTLKEPVALGLHDTHVTLHETVQGYFWTLTPE